jgi:hypothetical protein
VTTTGPEPLERLLDGMQQAGLDINVDGLMDAFWLALQPGLRLDVSAPPTATAEPEIPVASDADGGTAPTVEPGPGIAPKKTPEKPTFEDRPAGTPDLGLFGAIAGENEKETRPASPLRIPAGAALAGKLPLTRSLRPLRQWFKNAQIQELNEEETVEATAEAGRMLMPVLQPRLERWYELIVVADSVPSMEVWFETTVEFEEVARNAGVFRDIRHYRLVWRADDADVPDAPTSENSAVLLNAEGVPLRAVTLAQTNVRRLIFIATNGSALHWIDGRMAALLKVWSKQCSVAMVQMLPERFWDQVRTGEPQLLLRTLSPGAPAALLDAAAFWWDEDPEDSEGNLSRRIQGAIPILPLDPAWMGKWARMQMGGGQRVPGIVVGNRADRKLAPQPGTPEEWKRAVDAFSRNCTPEARSLAVYLSRGTFTLPVARLVQAARLGNAASQTQLAEILLSGLVQRVTAADAKVPREWVEYRFHPDAAKLLLRGLRESDANEIADALAKHIERYWGKPVDFRALVYDPSGVAAIPRWAQPFAQLGRSLLNIPRHVSPVVELFGELFEQFRQSQPRSVIGRAAHLAAAAGQDPLRSRNIQLWNALVESRLVSRNDSGEWRFLPGIQPLLAGVASTTPLLGVELLWVDDIPSNNRYEAGHLKAQGAAIQTELETNGALATVHKTRFDVIISDMTRGADGRAGFTLLDRLRSLGVTTPVIIYAGRFATTGREAAQRAGAFGCTNNPEELFGYVSRAAYLDTPRTVRAQVGAVLRTIGFSPQRISELLEHWQGSPESIAAELLGRAPNRDMAFRNHLQVIRAYAGSGVNQLVLVQKGALWVAADAMDDGKNRYPVASWDGLIGRAARLGQIVWAPDVSRERGYIAAEPTTASELVLPLLMTIGEAGAAASRGENRGADENGVLGVINIEMSLKNALYEDEIDWLARFAVPLGEWILNERPAGKTVQPEQPEPKAANEAGGQPDIAESSSQAAYTEVSLFYATDRVDDGSLRPPVVDYRRKASAESEVEYGAGRATQLSFGICRVTIPHAHRLGNLELPTLLRLQFRSDREKHFTLGEVHSLPNESVDDFSRRLNRQGKGVLIYVHGFNVDFRQTVLRCAQISYDTAVDAVPLVYSWPSQGTTAGYLRDEVTAEWTAPHLSELIVGLRSGFPSEYCYLLAEGLGCRALLSALQRSQSARPSQDPNLLQVIFVRPDVDAEVFGGSVRELSRIAGRITVYVSSRDRSLEIASRLRSGPRAGSSVQIIPQVDTIDVYGGDTALMNAGFTREMLADIHYVLQAIPPEKRPLRRVTTSEGFYWVLGDGGPPLGHPAS